MLNMKEDMKMIKRETDQDANCLSLSLEDLKDYCEDDYNTVMVVTQECLITCDTMRGGLCSGPDRFSTIGLRSFSQFYQIFYSQR